SLLLLLLLVGISFGNLNVTLINHCSTFIHALATTEWHEYEQVLGPGLLVRRRIGQDQERHQRQVGGRHRSTLAVDELLR
ncbi:hypothetical protein PENTCL1PPCAC_3900, partial [Pristionchus entomophagus]